MLQALVNRMLDRQERRIGQSLDWARELYATSPRAFRRFARIYPLVRHREALPVPVWAVAHLEAARAEDCGSCLQIAVNLAREAGLEAAVIRAVLDGEDAALPEELALARRFTAAICERNLEAEALRPAVRAAWGRRGEVDLACAVLGGRAIPILKRGLGHALSCTELRIRGEGETALAPRAEPTHPGGHD